MDHAAKLCRAFDAHLNVDFNHHVTFSLRPAFAAGRWNDLTNTTPRLSRGVSSSLALSEVTAWVRPPSQLEPSSR